MSSRVKRSFRPGAECVEERCLATAQVMAAGVGLADAAVHRQEIRAAIQAARHRGHPARPGASGVGAPNGGLGLIRLGLPSGFLDYGVVTLWNNTRTNVSFTVSASTYHNGQPYPFSLRPGQAQSFFAPVVHGNVPLFQVRINGGAQSSVPLPNDNIVFESPAYRPSVSAGWPYAINFGVNGYTITAI